MILLTLSLSPLMFFSDGNLGVQPADVCVLSSFILFLPSCDIFDKCSDVSTFLVYFDIQLQKVTIIKEIQGRTSHASSPSWFKIDSYLISLRPPCPSPESASVLPSTQLPLAFSLSFIFSPLSILSLS